MPIGKEEKDIYIYIYIYLSNQSTIKKRKAQPKYTKSIQKKHLTRRKKRKKKNHEN